MARSFFGGSGRTDQRKSQQSRGRKSRKSSGRRPLFEELEARHLLTTFTVLNNADAGAGSLRDALAMADTAAGADVIAFAAALSGQTITLTTGELGINDPVTINGLGAANLTIDAATNSRVFNLSDEAGDVTIKGLTMTNGRSGLFASGGAIVSDSIGLLTIADSTITGSSALFNGGAISAAGDLTLTGTTIGGVGPLANQTGLYGGGIFAQGNITLKSCTVSGNISATDGGGIYGQANVSLDTTTVGGTAAGTGNTAANNGGGIHAVTLVLLNSTVSGNTATTLSGGGIYARASVTLNSSTVSGNTSGASGGGIYCTNGSVSIQNSTIGGSAVGAGNTAAQDGGGIFGRVVNVVGSTIAGNTASNGSAGDGGGIYGTTITVRNSTISGNNSGDHGGGIYGKNSVTLQNATVANNTADFDAGVMGLGGGVYSGGSFKMQNSIVVGNSDTDNGNPDLKVSISSASQVKFSLIGDNSGAVGVGGAPAAPGTQNAQGNFIGTGVTPTTVAQAFGAGGGALANNGGTTETIELKAGSIVINKGKNSLVVSPSQGDQRGLPYVRVFGGTVDMGAFESQPPVPGNIAPIVANAIPDQNAIIDTPFVFTFAANTFTDANGDPLSYTATLSSGGALPAWLTFNAAARTFIGVPTAVDLGANTIRVTASDGKGGTIFDDFILTVISNPPPTVANAIPDQNATVSVPFNFTFAANTFTDPNGDTLAYSAALAGGGALPGWLTFNPATRTFSGTPGAGDVGTIAVRVTADDGHGNTIFDDFNITVSTSELPFNENFEGAVDARIVEKSPAFTTTTTNPLNGTASFVATRPTVGSRPVATVDFALPATAGNVATVNVNVSTGGGNGTTLWSNAVIVFDYVSPANYKFAGVFEIIDRLIIGQVVNGKVSYLAQRAFPALPNTSIPLSLGINRVTRQVTLTSGATSFSHTFAALGTGTVGVGTINANARFDNLNVG